MNFDLHSWQKAYFTDIFITENFVFYECFLIPGIFWVG